MHLTDIYIILIFNVNQVGGVAGLGVALLYFLQEKIVSRPFRCGTLASVVLSRFDIKFSLFRYCHRFAVVRTPGPGTAKRNMEISRRVPA